MSAAIQTVMRRVPSAGIELAVWESGPRDAPTVILVHGFPDTHEVWSRVLPLLAQRLHVVVYDVRGAGSSQVGPGTPYALETLAEDLFAVARTCGHGRPVHVVGHDWGAIQAWEAVTAAEAPATIAGFTALSGPCLDHIGHWLRSHATFAEVAWQAPRSVYVGCFGVPGLGPAAVRALFPMSWRLLQRQGISEEVAPSRERLLAAVEGVQLYRQNVLRRFKAPGQRRARVPVQLVVVHGDAFVTPALARTAVPWVDELYRRDVHGPHWIVRTEPEKIAHFVHEFVEQVEGKADAPSAARTTGAPGVQTTAPWR